MYKKILVPLDGSGRAEAILSHVQDIAASNKVAVVLLRVIEPSPVIVGPQETGAQMYMEEMKVREIEAEEYLRVRRGELRDMGFDTNALVMHGPVVESIIKAANTEDVDLIAMASHGRSGLGHVFYGSVAAGVLNRIDRPLLLIRSRDRKDG